MLLSLDFLFLLLKKEQEGFPDSSTKLAADELIVYAETKFCVELFFPIIDTITLKARRTFQRSALFCCQIFQLSVSEEFISEIYQFDMCPKSEQLQNYCKDLSEEILYYRACFREDVVEMAEDDNRIRSAADVLKHLCENEITSFYSKLVSIVLFRILCVTVATAERSFSNLKIIKLFLGSACNGTGKIKCTCCNFC